MENSKPLISIITITYNAASQLPATLKSINAQTCKDFEHIIVDGASSDDTLAIARSLGSPHARILSEPDNGLYFAMNKGLALAKGEYILFLNAGDAFHEPDSLLKYASAAKSKPDIIYADTIIVDDNRNFLRPRHLSVPECLSFESFKNGMLVCHQAFMVRREIAPPFDTAYRFSADYDWTVKCLRLSSPRRCVNLHTVAIDYLDAGTTEKNKRASLIERFNIMRHHYGSLSTITHHLAFIPRALNRKLGLIKK